ncbi:hypothetical protein DFR26_1019 [Paraperlucidibaca baekdonensis]|uniref:Oligosaccharide repeat unit polymerase n=1 Tax=Paraperlucidibaca baekdonensis TaxID=748120 RepID=A0A3E0H736_9GAMM|nr:hypothetical protein [Paraperlucidibaca baekdonensis]REH38854.1 hypothetical protein DFR26_1019 [Paraperlucidibaca baekdonensis]
MNGLKSPVGLFYFFLIVFIFIVPVDSGFIIKLISSIYVFLLWVGYFIGSSLQCKRKLINYNVFISKPRSLFVVVFLISSQLVLSIYAGKYYTGLNFSNAFQNLFLGDSNYAIYQAYFDSESLGSFSINKLPAIFSVFYVKFIFIFMLYFFVVKKDGRYDFLVVLFSAFSIVVLAVFRGTNFEFFEILVALVCSFYIRSIFNSNYKFPFFKVFALASFLVFIYVIQIMFRYSFEYSISCNNAYCYDYESVFHQLLPVISSAFYKLSAYFYFAPDYMARWFIYYLDNNLFLTVFVPGNGVFYEYTGKWLCGEEFSCGPTWAPDFEVFTYFLGLPLVALLIIFLAFFQKYLKIAAGLNFIDFLGFYLIILQLYALPVGNFLFVSSANQLMLILFLTLFVFRYLSRKSKKIILRG